MTKEFVVKKLAGKGNGVGVVIDVIVCGVFIANDVRKCATGGMSGQDLAANTATNVTGTAGGFVGALIGQAVCPIPVVGAFIGGVLGSVAINLGWSLLGIN